MSEIKPMAKMCDSCPFGHLPKQRRMRKSLKPGRFNEICQSVFQGHLFSCHKTTAFDDDGEWKVTERDRECAGAIEFYKVAWANRERAERRAQGTK